jgi:phosphoserine phosphatase RsbU/P
MIRSINTKMLLLVFGILTTMALLLLFFTREDLEKKFLETEEQSVRNVIYLVKLNIENQYGSLLFHKLATLEKRKAEMKKLTTLVVSDLDQFQQLSRKGILKEDEARAFALDRIATLKCDEDSCFFVYDEKGTVLAHPDSAVIGKNLSDLKDIKGVSVFHSMLEAARTKGDGVTSFTWHCGDRSKSSKKLGYFTYYPRLKWMVATMVNMEDIELDAQKRLDAIVHDLKHTFGNVRIAETGYLFLFHGNKELIIHPSLAGKALADVINLRTGTLLLDDLKAAAQHPEQPVEYVLEDPQGKSLGPYLSYVQYFKTLDWYIVSSALEAELMIPVRKAVLRQSSLIALIFVVSMVVTSFLVRRISQPLKKLAAYARELPEHDFAAEEASAEISDLPIRYRDEVGNLAAALLFMQEALRQYIVDLRETTATKERIESELKIASEIQMSILPRTFPPFPERTDFDIYATIKPAREVGGDFFDFFLIDGDHLFFTIGDVSGKGVPASLFMAITRTLLKANALIDTQPDEIVLKVNNKLAENNETCVFVTVFCGILTISTGQVVYTNGGHNPPLLIRAGETVDFINLPKGMALGIVEDTPYQRASLVMGPGDVLFMYTDGVTEAMNQQYELFSEKRLQGGLASLKATSIQEMSHDLMQQIMAFAEGAQQSDDITMLILKYHGDKQPRGAVTILR